MKYSLITTADENTWEPSEKSLMLGEWCALYSRKEYWSKLDITIAPYHWDDRGKLSSDYKYLSIFYENILEELSASLNALHNTDHSIKYWRIIIGPWLGAFMQQVFDRWETIRTVLLNYNIGSTIFFDVSEKDTIPYDMSDFWKLTRNELWNHHIYKTIINETAVINYKTIPCESKVESYAMQKKHDEPKIKATILCAYNILKKLSKLNSICIYGSEFSHRELIYILLKLKQFPAITEMPVLEKNNIDINMRNNFIVNDSNEDAFKKYFRKIIPKQIPVIYLEEYNNLSKSVADFTNRANKKKYIYTSIAHMSDDIFKAYAAHNVEQGAKLILRQHGGHYGTGKWSFLEEHEMKIADKYFSWGWSYPESTNVIPVPSAKLLSASKVFRENKNGGLLQVTCCVPRYSYHLLSFPVASQYLYYLDEQFRFVETLNEGVRNKHAVRLYQHDFSWCQAKRWKDRLSDINFDEKNRSIDESINKSRLVVGTYNSTIFLETFVANIPTVLFWNPEYWELNKESQPYYDMLRKAQILFDTPESAAKHVNLIWNDVNGWWNDRNIQKVREAFCYEYAMISPDWFEPWKAELQSA